MGSKNKIAREIIGLLPPADTFVDLFAGGCAMTHAAMLSGKYRNFIINDVDPLPTQLFIDAIDGKYSDGYKWYSRDEFNRLKDSDGFVKFCYSFGSDGVDYLYSKVKEPWKRALFYAVVHNDFSALYEFGVDITIPDDDIRARQKAIQKLVVDGRLQFLESVNRVNRLTELKPYRDKITTFTADYTAVETPENSVIYCDIPYTNTHGYNNAQFNREAFLDWAAGRENLYISEYSIDDGRFNCIWEKQRISTYSAQNNGLKVTERLYKTR